MPPDLAFFNFLKKDLFIYFVYVSVLPAHTYVCAPHMHSAERGQKRVSHLLEQELKVVVSHLM